MTKRLVLLDALASTPGDIARLIRNVDEATADWMPEAKPWSCRMLLGQLCSTEPLYLAQWQTVLLQDAPLLETVAIHSVERERAPSVRSLVDQFRVAREMTVAALAALTPGQWQRAAYREGLGRTTLRYLVQDHVNRDIEFTSRIVEVLQSRRAFLAAKTSD